MHAYGNGDKNLPLYTRGPPRRTVTSLDEHIAEIFKKTRTGKNISLAEFSSRSGIKIERLIRIEAGYVLPFITELEAMANALGTKFWMLMQEAEKRQERANAVTSRKSPDAMPKLPQGQKRIGARVYELRTSKGLSQEELADRSGLHRCTIGMFERGERNISPNNLKRIAAALDMSLSELLQTQRG